jgi:hypothetical protein
MFSACLLLLPALALGALAPETYTIKFKHYPSVGKIVTVKDTSKESGTVKVSDADGKVISDEKVDSGKEEVYTQKVLEKGDKKPKKFSQTYQKAILIKKGREMPRSYQGCTIIYDLKDNKYELTVEGDKPVTKEDMADLKKQANDQDSKEMDEILLPGKAVKVGDTWKLDVKKLGKSFGSGADLDAGKSKGEAKLIKVYSKNKKQYGVIELDMKLAIKGLPGNLKFDPPATTDMKMTLDVCIDGSDSDGTLKMAGKLKGKGTIEQMGMKFTMDFAIDNSGLKEQSPEK